MHSWTLEIITEINPWLEAEREPALSIPDNDPVGIEDSLDITEQGQVIDMEVWVDITHTWIGDLQVTLTGPSSAHVLLHDRSGGNQDNLIKLYDLESLPALSTFENTPCNGSWTLTVSDNAGRDTGKLNSWGIRLKR